MTVKELLEAAARAAGIEITEHDGLLFVQRSMVHKREWNPLKDDGDALRLAVKLGIDIQHFKESERVEAWISPWDAREEDYKSDRYAATRRAIVRATAALDSGHNA